MHFLNRRVLLAVMAILTSPTIFASPLPTALPNTPAAWFLFRLPQADLIVLLEQLEHPGENAERLLASDDPAEIGLGIFIASFSGDLDRLLGARDLLFDERQTIPMGDFISAHDASKMQRGATTVGRYLARTYAAWFGVTSATAARPQELHEIVTGIAERGDAWKHAAAWHRRYLIEIPEATRAEILEQVRALTPDDIRTSYSGYSARWARIRAGAATPRVVEDILAIPNETLRLFVARELGYSGTGKSTTGQEDVQRILDSLSPETREAVRTRSLEFPPDRVYHEPSPGDFQREGVYRWYEERMRRTP